MKSANITNTSHVLFEQVTVVSKELSYLMCTAALLRVVICLLTMHILLKCRKLTTQIRLMSLHMTFTNLIIGLWLFYLLVTNIFKGSLCGSIVKLLPIPYVTFDIFLTVAGLDRLLSIIYSIKYTLWTKLHNLKILVASLYIIGIGINVPNDLSNPFACDVLFTYRGSIIIVYSGIVLVISNVVIYSYIGLVAMRAQLRRPGRMTKDYRRMWLSTLKTFGLSIITSLLRGPFLVSRMIDLWKFENGGDPKFSQTSEMSGTLVIFYLIITRIYVPACYKECRYHMAMLCCCCCRHKRQQIVREYKQHYATYAIAQTRAEHVSSLLWLAAYWRFVPSPYVPNYLMYMLSQGLGNRKVSSFINFWLLINLK